MRDPLPTTRTTSSRRVHPRVYLHIGEPKTATTFVQQAMRAAAPALAARGVHLPGADQHAVFRATQDLRRITKRQDDPAAPWDGEWDQLARRALRTPGVSVISHELLCAADDEQAARAVASLGGAEVHVVLTVRDIASMLPAEWQESVKHRSTRGWDDWLGDVVDKEFCDDGPFAGFGPQPDDRRRDHWFWRVHDTLRVLEIWGQHVPRERMHVVTLPPRGSDRSLLLDRFAAVLGIPSGVLDPSAVGRSNDSLGLAEIELLRRLNSRLSPDVPDWYYMAAVKEPLAHGALARRPARARLELPADRMAWANAYADHLVTGLATAGYPVVGDLDDLRPAPATDSVAHPADASDEDQLDAAVASCAALLERLHRQMTTTSGRLPSAGELLLGALSSAPGLRRRLYALSDRNRVVGAARGRVRDGIERARERA